MRTDGLCDSLPEDKADRHEEDCDSAYHARQSLVQRSGSSIEPSAAVRGASLDVSSPLTACEPRRDRRSDGRGSGKERTATSQCSLCTGKGRAATSQRSLCAGKGALRSPQCRLRAGKERAATSQSSPCTGKGRAASSQRRLCAGKGSLRPPQRAPCTKRGAAATSQCAPCTVNGNACDIPDASCPVRRSRSSSADRNEGERGRVRAALRGAPRPEGEDTSGEPRGCLRLASLATASARRR